MPSSQTRTKLKGFAFIGSAPSEEAIKLQEEEKENISVEKAGATPRTTKVAQDIENKTSETPKLVQSKTCPPSTPATRLPLADLVGNADDSRRHIPKPVVSPEDQLCWRGSQPVNTPLPRKRKRARSSSPVAASQDEPKIEPADLIKQDLTTPQADPAQELWNRYTSNKGTPSANKSVAFAHLINESSPRSSSNTGSVSGLRRWASCGVEFPASTRKRRRIGGVLGADTNNKDGVFDAPSSDGVFQGPPEKSKLAGMLQKMRDSINKPASRISSQLPSSSSPLPDPGDRRACPEESPLQRHARDQGIVPPEVIEADMEVVEEDEAVADPPRRSSGSSDDFGDGDFDTEMVEALEISQQVTKPSNSHASVSTEPVVPIPPVPAPQASVADTGSDDEFGIDDEDLFAADLEEVASLYDTRREVSPPEIGSRATAPAAPESHVPSVAAPVINLVEDDSDDEFGDDIDADELAAAEVVATQGYTTVCRIPVQ